MNVNRYLRFFGFFALALLAIAPGPEQLRDFIWSRRGHRTFLPPPPALSPGGEGRQERQRSPPTARRAPHDITPDFHDNLFPGFPIGR